jgi:hypothetical protein
MVFNKCLFFVDTLLFRAAGQHSKKRRNGVGYAPLNADIVEFYHKHCVNKFFTAVSFAKVAEFKSSQRTNEVYCFFMKKAGHTCCGQVKEQTVR